MSIFSNDIPNRIKQPSFCCVHCGKSYKKRENLNKHVTICDFLQKPKKSSLEEEEEEDNIISYKDLCNLVRQLAESNKILKKEVQELKAQSSKKKKKINAIEWLNKHTPPTIMFDEFIHTIHITEEDILSFIEYPFMEILNNIFSKYIYDADNAERPISALTQKTNMIYIYDTDRVWKESPDDKLIKFLNRIHSKIVTKFCDWKTSKKKEIMENDNLKTKCEKTQIKLMNVIFSEKPTLAKVKSMIYHKIKTDIQETIEYDIET